MFVCFVFFELTKKHYCSEVTLTSAVPLVSVYGLQTFTAHPTLWECLYKVNYLSFLILGYVKVLFR